MGARPNLRLWESLLLEVHSAQAAAHSVHGHAASSERTLALMSRWISYRGLSADEDLRRRRLHQRVLQHLQLRHPPLRATDR